MKCRECAFLEHFAGELWQCANPDSENYEIFTGICSEDECDDGEYLVPPEQEGE